ncbi:MAG: DUF1848 domain-containing protein [Treponema sp.]|jgi:hypothetical protein|nr:DUF1848 domain-containing protein [Treponema sp.]
MIISASRRCDIPRFQFDWFLERLDAGFVEVRNPFNAAQIRRVSLLPGDVDALVFWTRDPVSIAEHGADMEKRGCPFYVMVTITGYPAMLEPKAPPEDAVIDAMRRLAERFGISRVAWRYDPVLLSTVTDAEFHRDNFAALASKLNGAAGRVIISVYDDYAASRRRLAALERMPADQFKLLPHYDGDGRITPELRRLLADLPGISRDNGMTMQSCAEAEDLSALGIRPGACIDGDLALRGIAGKDKNQRPHCLCAAAADIGSYGPCPAGCVYCYARR